MITTGITFAPNTKEIDSSSNSMVAKYLKNNPLGIGFLLNDKRKNKIKSEGNHFGNVPFTNETIYRDGIPSDFVSRWD
ncbi:hypothetical protein [Ulvibacterium sp.]|uniref:hypothetical protein n=1 Tax=Ulvibacterium sp. TaxID=2665914 RepID=UPI003BA8F2F4